MPAAGPNRGRRSSSQGANYRLIDIPVSNCINSEIVKIYCLTQFNSASLNRHLSSAYVRFPCCHAPLLAAGSRAPPRAPQNSNVGSYTRSGFVEVLAAQQSPENPDWFQGTADAVRQYLWLFKARFWCFLVAGCLPGCSHCLPVCAAARGQPRVSRFRCRTRARLGALASTRPCAAVTRAAANAGAGAASTMPDCPRRVARPSPRPPAVTACCNNRTTRLTST